MLTEREFRPPDEITESTFRVTAVNKMNMQRVLMPQVRVQRRCPWEFPAALDQRQEAVNGGANGKYSRFYRCGYSPDVPGGAGALNGAVPYTTCSFTRSDCEARGMFNQDGSLQTTRRFGGMESYPSQRWSIVRSIQPILVAGSIECCLVQRFRPAYLWNRVVLT